MQKYVLCIEGKDARGLIYHVTGVLYRNRCNIIDQDEYVTPDDYFYMRTEFESTRKIDHESLLTEFRNALSHTDVKLRFSAKKKKDVVLCVTKEHHCLAELLTRFSFNELEANVVAVVSNYDILEPFVQKFNIPFHTVSHEGLTREKHEEAVMEVIDMYKPDLLVLAKYMRILSPEFVDHYQHKIINIHHSFLPAFIGANPYRQAYERGVKIIGATAHFVNNELDQGPIIAQDVTFVDHKFLASDMSRVGKDVEKMVLIKGLKLVLADRVFIHDNRTIIL
jgi:formyltetrahydrofolate deformylase